MPLFRAKRCCRNCQFLNKRAVSIWGDVTDLSWDATDRALLQVKEHYAASCWRGVWDTGIAPELNAQLPALLTKNRSGKCFFVEWSQGMSYPGAIELHREMSTERRVRNSNRLAKIAIAIATASVLATVIFGVQTLT